MVWWSSEDSREQIKAEMIEMRIKRYGVWKSRDSGIYQSSGGCYCDLCLASRGTDMHEIINRARSYDDDVRTTFYQPELCSILCNECHTYYAHSQTARRELFLFNYDLYGKSKVLEAFGKVPEYYRRGIVLP